MAGIQKTVEKGIRYLKKRGIRKTLRKTALHVDRKRLERAYIRRMMPTAEQLAAQRAEGMPEEVCFSVIVPLYNTPMALLRETLDSVAGQSYGNWELCLADGSDDAHGDVGEYCRERAAAEHRIRYRKLPQNEGISGNSNAALEMARGDYIALFDHDDLLRADALYEMAKAIGETGADFLYSDEMIFESPKVTRVLGIRFKQDFAPEDLWTNNFICHLTVFRRDLLEVTGGFRGDFDGSQDHDLVLRLTAAAKQIRHIPQVLYFWRSVPGSVAADIHMKEYAIDAGRRAVEAFLRSRGRGEIRVESTEAFPTMYRLRIPVAGEPSVRVIIWPGSGAESGLSELRAGTRWKNIRWQVLAPGAQSRNEAFRRAAEAAEEDYLVFLDEVPEALNPDWIREMLQWAQEEEIGAVGAKIRLAGGTDLRHAGIVLGLGPEGVAGRAYFDMEDDGVGFFGQLAVARNVTAVTDGWMIRREKYRTAGGFDPEYGDALFDIDLCLRLKETGYRNMWVPEALLSGGEAKEFALDVGKEYASYARDSARFRQKWAEVLKAGDSCYNPNLSLKHEDWRIDGEKL
ncbi:MAG: glycosyltransferase [Clostridia bacterium]|nr:glycosyltransferase [Clostridia bacterium]